MIAVISDVHFPSDKERQKSIQSGLRNMPDIHALFICGDFTDNRNDTKEGEDMHLPDYMRDLPYPVFFIDGNHEDYNVLKRLPEIDEAEREVLLKKHGCNVERNNTRKAADGIYYLKRGSVCTADGFSILAIGASTTGPGYKKNHPDIWQPDEDLTPEDEERISDAISKNNNTFDLVMTHTVPERMVRAWFPEKDLSVTNDILYRVWKKISYRYWMFGHFHQDIDYPEKFHCLYRDIILFEKQGDSGIRMERVRMNTTFAYDRN